MRAKLSICMFNPPIWGNFKIGQMKPFKTPQNLSLVFLKLANKGLPLHKPFLPLLSPPKPNSQTKPKEAEALGLKKAINCLDSMGLYVCLLNLTVNKWFTISEVTSVSIPILMLF